MYFIKNDFLLLIIICNLIDETQIAVQSSKSCHFSKKVGILLYEVQCQCQIADLLIWVSCLLLNSVPCQSIQKVLFTNLMIKLQCPWMKFKTTFSLLNMNLCGWFLGLCTGVCAHVDVFICMYLLGWIFLQYPVYFGDQDDIVQSD